MNAVDDKRVERRRTIPEGTIEATVKADGRQSRVLRDIIWRAQGTTYSQWAGKFASEFVGGRTRGGSGVSLMEMNLKGPVRGSIDSRDKREMA
jgi:hypothetical protein